MSVETQDRTLRLNDKGDDVKHLQDDLNLLKYGPVTSDSQFGAKTEAAVKHFQKDKKLSADGVVGPKTWQILHELASSARRAS
jgi:peptidoglycan hydrolase-like protein with peptidoglycan-binding domain